MKITQVTPLFLDPTLLVRVETDAGIVGWGECSPMNGPVVAAHIRHALARIVVGRHPFDIEPIVEELFMRPYKIAGQSHAMAISGVEIALWDIMGEALQVPIYKLLGGAYRTRIRMYASSMRRDIAPRDEAGRLARLVEDKGFTAVKVRVGQTYGFDADDALGLGVEINEQVLSRAKPL